MLFSFLTTVNCYQDLLVTLKKKVARLHELTKASTYYEFFNLTEGSSESDIKKAFRRLKKSTPPANLTKEQFNELLMNGYSVLNNYRKAYDDFLSDSKFIYMVEPANFKNYFIITIVAIACVLVFADFVVYAFKYLKYIENVENYKQAKKNDDKGKSSKKDFSMDPPSMLLKRIFQRSK